MVEETFGPDMWLKERILTDCSSLVLRQLTPDDHKLVLVGRVLDLSWLRDEVAKCYCCDDGRSGIDPEVAVRLMLAGPALLEMLGETAPARLVLLRPFADTKNFWITLVIHPDRYQQRHVADLARPAALEHEAA